MGVHSKRIAFCLLALIGWSLIVSCRGMGAHTYYVAATGSDANPGSQSQPWKTIQKAAEAMIAGDMVLIHAGTYYENVMPRRSGVEGKYITYQDFGDGEVILDAQGGARPHCIEVSGQAYLQFIGLHLRNAGYAALNAAFVAFEGSHHLVLDRVTAETSRFGIELKGKNTSSEDPVGAVRFVTIKNSVVRNNAAYGIFLYYKVTDIVIGPNNKIYNENETNGVPEDDQYGIDLDTDYPGIPANGPVRVSIVGNEVYGNRIQGIRPWNAQYVLIQDNYVHHNGATGIQVEDGCSHVIVDGNRAEFNAQSHEYEAGIWIDSTQDAVVQNNVVRGNQIGVMVTVTDRALVRHNIIYENNRAPTGSNVMGAVLNSDSADIVFVHNTLWQNGAPESRGNLAFCIKPPVSRTVIKNNIFAGSAGAFDGWLNCAVTSDFNNFYNTRDLVVSWQGKDLNWPAYLSASSQDNHSITTNPMFMNPAEGDFSLLKQSPDLGSGSPLTQTTAAGSGKTISLGDARYFSDGYGLVVGDAVRIGAVQAVIVKVDLTANTITVDREVRWNQGDAVSYRYTGANPDRGAVKLGAIP
jgi:parallel beta-helix repeat protein